MGFAALNTGNNLLYLVLSLMLAFLVLSGVMSESALRGIRVRRRLPREIFAGGANPIGLEITNDQRRVPSFAVVVSDRLRGGADAGRVFALRIGPGERETRFYRLSPERRGPVHFSGFHVSTRFPFGLFSKAMRIESEGEALAYPQVEPTAPRVRLGRASGGGETLSGGAGAGAEVSGLREFAPGDSVRRIHWRASVRRGELVTREVASEDSAEARIRLRTRGERAGEAFEASVRRAASQVVAHLEAGQRVALETDGERLPADSGATHRARLLSFLALVEPGAAARSAAGEPA